MTDRFKGFLITLDKEIREDDSEHILTALGMIKGVAKVQPYITGAEDWMMYQKGVMDTRLDILGWLHKDIKLPSET